MPARPVTVLAAGGTIAMSGGRAVPTLDVAALLAAVPGLANVDGLDARQVRHLAGPQMSLGDALAVAHEAATVAAGGRGVVVTHGTDTMEETAVLCDWLHGGEAPIVFTGAMRPATATGADGPANLADAVSLAGAAHAAGIGVAVVFAGEIHAAAGVRKIDSTSPRAFGSPRSGAIGFVAEGRVELTARPRRPLHALKIDAWNARVECVHLHIGDDGGLLRAAGDADGLVVVALGAGHIPLGALPALRDACTRMPVVATVRPARGSILHATYGFDGSEGDLRAAGAICAGSLSPPAARMVLGACLSAGLDAAAIRAALAPFDA